MTLSKPDRKLPVFRARIEGYEFRLPSWKDRFVMRTAPEPLGGYDFARARSTTPGAWGTPMPFSSVGPEGNGKPGLFDVPALLIAKALDAYANHRAGRARDEVRRELADVEAHNARVAAGLSDDGSSGEKTTGEKKQVEKKQPDKQEKKKDQ